MINELLFANKQALVKAIFNSDSVQIGNITLTMPDDIVGRIGIAREGDKLSVSYQNTTVSFSNLWITEDEDELLDRKKNLLSI